MRSPTRLLLVALAASLPSCERHSTALNDAEWWRLEGDREASAQRLTLLQTQFTRANGVQQEVDSLSASTGNLAQAKRTLEAQRAQITADIATLDDQVQDARHEWAAAKRTATIGRSFVSLTSRAGRTYENVTVTRVTDAGIEFRHQNGSGRFSALEMTPQQMDDFGIESADAIAAHQQERADAHAYNRAIDKAVADNKADRNDSGSKSSSSRGRTDSSGGSSDSGRSASASPGSSRGGSPVLASNGGSRSRLDEPARFFSSRYPRTYYRGATYYYGTGYSWPSAGVARGGGSGITGPTSPIPSGRTSPTGPVMVPAPAPRPAPTPRTPATQSAATP